MKKMDKKMDKTLRKQLRDTCDKCQLIDFYGVIGAANILSTVKHYWLTACDGVGGDILYDIIGVELEEKGFSKLLEEEPYMLDINLSVVLSYELGAVLDYCTEEGVNKIADIISYLKVFSSSFEMYYDEEGCGLIYWYH